MELTVAGYVVSRQLSKHVAERCVTRSVAKASEL